MKRMLFPFGLFRSLLLGLALLLGVVVLFGLALLPGLVAVAAPAPPAAVRAGAELDPARPYLFAAWRKNGLTLGIDTPTSLKTL